MVKACSRPRTAFALAAKAEAVRKSLDPKGLCRFDSGLGHQFKPSFSTKDGSSIYLHADRDAAHGAESGDAGTLLGPAELLESLRYSLFRCTRDDIDRDHYLAINRLNAFDGQFHDADWLIGTISLEGQPLDTAAGWDPCSPLPASGNQAGWSASAGCSRRIW
jgi:hypothetical protein